MFHGVGVQTNADGSKYDGSWVLGSPCGRGTYTTKDGNSVEGTYMNDTFQELMSKLENGLAKFSGKTLHFKYIPETVIGIGSSAVSNNNSNDI